MNILNQLDAELDLKILFPGVTSQMSADARAELCKEGGNDFIGTLHWTIDLP